MVHEVGVLLDSLNLVVSAVGLAAYLVACCLEIEVVGEVFQHYVLYCLVEHTWMAQHLETCCGLGHAVVGEDDDD
jgi:hypothetical protein